MSNSNNHKLMLSVVVPVYNVEEYLDSGDYDDYDEAYEAAMDDYKYDHDY